MAAPIGNTYGRTSRVLEQCLKRVVAQDDGQRLRKACEAALTHASKGSLPHLEFIANRLDGAIRKSDEADAGDARALTLGELMQAIMAARKSEAIDTVPAIAQADQPSDTP